MTHRSADEVDVAVNGTDAKVSLKTDKPVQDGDVQLIIRPEKLRLAPAGTGRMSGTLRARVFQGNLWLFQLTTPAGEMWACQLNEGQQLPDEGAEVSLIWNDPT